MLPVGVSTILALASSGCSGPLSTLDPGGPSSSTAAGLWWGMFVFSSLVLMALVALWVYAVRYDPERTAERDVRRLHRRFVLFGGLLLPTSSITVLLAIGIPAGHSMLPLPLADERVVNIEVTGHQWWWEVVYPEAGVRLVDELHIPAGTAVDLRITSADVIHSFWVPRLGGKLDAIPGRHNLLRLRAEEPGTYRGQCAEFCGLSHAHMTFQVEVHSAEAFDEWLKAAGTHD
jgi:cytochrome c oxidase subunit II